MKLRCFVFLFGITMPFVLSAQDYLPFKLKNTSMYINAGNDIQAIRIDSVIASGQDTIYKNFPSITDINQKCIGSWIGSKIIKKSNGKWLFINKNNDTLVFNLNGKLDQTWVAYIFPDKRYLEASISSLTLESFIGISDSVKTITIVQYNSNGTNKIAHSEYKLSKKYGFIKFSDINLLPSYGPSYLLAGTSNPVVGLQNITAKDIWDFNIGDELISESQEGTNPQPIFQINAAMTKIKVLKKRISSNGDTLVYTDSVYSRKSTTYYTNDTHETKYQYAKYQSEIKIVLANHILNLLPMEYRLNTKGEVNLSPNGFPSNAPIAFASAKYDAVNNRMTKTISKYITANRNNPLECFGYPIGNFTDPFDFIQGLGGEYWVDDDFVIKGYNHLIYYKKGSVTWGTPVAQGVLTGMQEAGNDFSISISPSPITESAWLEIKGAANAAILTFTLSDLVGKEVLHLETTESKFKIERGNLSPGLYLYSVKSNENIFKQGKIFLQ